MNPRDLPWREWLAARNTPAFARRFAEALAREERGGSRLSPLAALAAWTALSNGDTCLDLGRSPFDGETPPWPAPEAWSADLASSSLVGGPGDARPFVLEGDRLYLARYHAYETELATGLRHLAAARPVPAPGTAELLARLFPGDGSANPRPDHQKLAAATAATRGLTVISGGPGTGKTTTLIRLVALLAQQPGIDPSRILLAAPTGKAAQRLGMKFEEDGPRLPLAPEALARLPRTASTLHTLLKPLPDDGGYRHHAGNPLPADLLVIDEVSMVDLPMFCHVLRALPRGCRLVLTGDADQLVSVQAGSVLADLLAAIPPNRPDAATRALLRPEWPAGSMPAPGETPLAGSVVRLLHTHRFRGDSSIAAACRAVLTGDLAATLEAFSGSRDGTARLHGPPTTARLSEALAHHPVAAGLLSLPASTTPEAALETLTRWRVLTALREGPWGAHALNAQFNRLAARPGAPLPAGTPLLITANAPALRLANGHVGIVWPDAQGRRLVHFPPGEGPGFPIPLARLPPHEPAWAMTTHKSQGSEFESVLVILGETPTRLHTRELLYTALSRARSEVDVWASEAALRACLEQRTERASGLAGRVAAERSESA